MMVLKRWNDLPRYMQNKEVKRYYKILKNKTGSLIAKRCFDFIVALIMIVILLPFLIIVSIAIKLDSKGPVMYRQVRVTQYGRKFKIFKFRTMVEGADKIGSQITTSNDARVTRIGVFLRKFRIDELPQLFNIILGDMSFVGTRPEVEKYVEEYTAEMMATLLLPAGVTSGASIRYKDEQQLLDNVENVDEVYVKEVLPGKMRYNLKSLKNYSFMQDIITLIKTVVAVIK